MSWNDGKVISLRRATPDDVPAVLGLFDEAIAWFLSIGNKGQWGTEPWSPQERQQRRVTEMLALPGAWVAVNEHDSVLGALVVGEAGEEVPAATEPELYVRVLIGSRRPEAKGVGRRLMAHADRLAAQAGLEYLRVDCYAGGTGKLVEFYESCGYERLVTFEVEGWPGQVLGRRLSAAAAQASAEPSGSSK
ncbi:MAG: GNAT family N-acetyltransferase [Arthrobacter sp.]|jgi:GNAT superfamily N-acetyltransferase|nr:GNAT family N-acetyltransferase [Arthrobacter sp.]